MHRVVAKIAAVAIAATSLSPATNAAQAQTRRTVVSRPAGPPHAWLFGTWTGGLFPPPSSLGAEVCLSQPVVIFTRDLVLRATLTDQLYVQRLIETALATANGVDIRFTGPLGVANGNDLLNGGPPVVPPGAGFGCATPNELTVERVSENRITFPNCRDFPYPLVRCSSR